ncbi:unnamed protein product, partial [Ectocarpus fasciculatus]
MVLNACLRIVRLQNPVRFRADGPTCGNFRWLDQPFNPGSDPQLADDPSCRHLRTTGVSRNPEARRRRDEELAVHPREKRRGPIVRRLALESEIFAAGSKVGIDEDIGNLRLFRLLGIL